MKTKDIIGYSNALSKGSSVQVRSGRQIFSGLLKARGAIEEIRHAEEEFIRGTRDSTRQPLSDCTNLAQLDKDMGISRKRQYVEEDRVKVQKPARKKKRNTSDKKFQRGAIIIVDPGQEDNDCSNDEIEKDDKMPNNAKEGATLDENVTANEGATLDENVTANEGAILDENVTAKEGAILDENVTANEGATLDENATVEDVVRPDENVVEELPNEEAGDEPWSHADYIELRTKYKEQDKRIRHLEATVELLSEKHTDLLKQVQLLQASRELASFAVVNFCTPSTPLTAFVMPQDTFTSTSYITTCTEKDTATCTQIPPTPVADIAEENLVSMDQVLAKYPKLCNKKSVTRLAVKLAKESVLGLQIMKESTPLGTQTLRK